MGGLHHTATPLTYFPGLWPGESKKIVKGMKRVKHAANSTPDRFITCTWARFKKKNTRDYRLSEAERYLQTTSSQRPKRFPVREVPGRAEETPPGGGPRGGPIGVSPPAGSEPGGSQGSKY